MDPDKDKPVSAFYPADNPAVIAHLNYLQAIITRLAGNGAQCKTWCLAIVSTLVGFAGASKNEKFVAAAIIPIVIFCLVDAAYLSHERAYRALYNSAVRDIRARTYTIAQSFDLSPPDDTVCYCKALCSWSVWPIYLGLVIGYALARAFGLL